MELTPREQVLLVGRELGIEETDNRTLCFFCGGGESKDRSFSITRVNKFTVKYRCHRAKCGERGTVMMDGSGESVANVQTAVFTPSYYPGLTSKLAYEELEYLDNKYGIDLGHVLKAGWSKVDVYGGVGFLMPIFSPSGEVRGKVLRHEKPDGTKDVKVFKEKDEQMLCWYRNQASPDVLLVEDQISALKAASYVTSVALLGTNLSYEKLDEVLGNSKGRIWLALDRDAHKTVFDYLRKYRGYCGGNFNALLLSKDIKNMKYPEINLLMKTLKP